MTIPTTRETGWALLERLEAEFAARGEPANACRPMAVGALTVCYDTLRRERDRLQWQLAEAKAALAAAENGEDE